MQYQVPGGVSGYTSKTNHLSVEPSTQAKQSLTKSVPIHCIGTGYSSFPFGRSPKNLSQDSEFSLVYVFSVLTGEKTETCPDTIMDLVEVKVYW